MSQPLVVIGLCVYIIVSCVLAYLFPQSVLAFLLVEASLLLLYYARVSDKTKIILGATVLLLLLPALGTVNAYYLEIAVQIGIFVALALGLNIVVGFVGLLNLGFVAFFAIGAYLWAIFGSPQANQFIPGGLFPLSPNWFFVFLILSIVVGALTGALLGLPVLRLRGDYLAIVTLGFAEVVRALVNNLDKPINLTNGPRGITPIAKPPLFFKPLLEYFGLEIADSALYPLYFYFLVLMIVFFIIVVTRRLENSHIGRAWKAIREDEIAAIAMGVPVVRMKLLGFAVGASFAAAVGVLFAAKQVFINPESFTLIESIMILCMVVLGGMGNIAGVVLGVVLLVALPEALRYIGPFEQALFGRVIVDPADLRMLIFGLALILVMLFRPAGLLPSTIRKREFAGEEEMPVNSEVNA